MTGRYQISDSQISDSKGEYKNDETRETSDSLL
jgi:hypothetical protein